MYITSLAYSSFLLVSVWEEGTEMMWMHFQLSHRGYNNTLVFGGGKVGVCIYPYSCVQLDWFLFVFTAFLQINRFFLG